MQEDALKAWQQRADLLLPDALQGDSTNAIDQQSSSPDVFFSHAGEHKKEVVDIICKEFRDKHPRVHVYLDQNSVVKGSRPLLSIGRACRSAAVGECTALVQPHVEVAGCWQSLVSSWQAVAAAASCGVQGCVDAL